MIHAASLRLGAIPARVTSVTKPRAAHVARFQKGANGGDYVKNLRDDTLKLNESDHMLCMQCEQALHNTGCNRTKGVCGKTEEVAALQDLMIFFNKGLGTWAKLARDNNVPVSEELNYFTSLTTFATLTNVNFSEDRFAEFLRMGQGLKEELKRDITNAGVKWSQRQQHPNALNQIAGALGVGAPDALDVPDLPWFPMHTHPANYDVDVNVPVEELVMEGRAVGLKHRTDTLGSATLAGLQELVCYGLKGLAAYYHHAWRLGARDEGVDAFIHECLAFLAAPESSDAAAVLAMAMRVGEVNGRVLQLLDEEHTKTFGNPAPHEVSTVPQEGKCILVSGHDMHDLKALLDLTEGTGIKVYTHGEMLPAHGYPGLRKYTSLAGHFGSHWGNQRFEFGLFPGPILMTTNCLMEPVKDYQARIYTTGAVGHDDCREHLAGPEAFQTVVDAALELPGFTAAQVEQYKPFKNGKLVGSATMTTGFGHHFVLSVADKVLGAISAGELKHIHLIGGCDGHEQGRHYYTDVARELPQDSVVLTLGCGKFRVNSLDMGTIPGESGLPRLMDMGQCNDAYSALVVAQTLAGALGCGVNDLPLTLNISWFEQKAVAVLLTLLNLGVKKIVLGPQLPAFLTPEARQLLVDTFELTPADLEHPFDDVQKQLGLAN
ncbi:unnamed protein product [Pedinophyceae sp. YPF-701]|nr:unnamed protein product [Pedinophyceae sp. YPF-701]